MDKYSSVRLGFVPKLTQAQRLFQLIPVDNESQYTYENTLASSSLNSVLPSTNSSVAWSLSSEAQIIPNNKSQPRKSWFNSLFSSNIVQPLSGESSGTNIDEKTQKNSNKWMIIFFSIITLFVIAALATNIYLLVYFTSRVTTTTTAFPCSAVAQTSITFDDLSNNLTGSAVQIPNGYKNLLWYNVFVQSGLVWSNTTGYYVGVASGAFDTYNGGGYPMYIYSVNTSSVFSIGSFQSCAAFIDGLVVQMLGSRSGTVIYNTTATLFVLSRSFIVLNWCNIDTFNMSTNSTWFTMDNLIVYT